MYQVNSLPEDDPILEIGVNIVSRHCDLYDLGHGRYEYLPTIDKLLFIRCRKSEYNLAFIKQKVKEQGFGAAFTIREYWIAEADENCPF